MNKYFCLYCAPDIFGVHDKSCKLFKDVKEEKKEEVLDRYGKILQDIAEMAGYKNKEKTKEIIEEQIDNLKGKNE